jgi:hypothetical protein
MRKCNLHAIHRQDFCTVIVPHEPTALCEDAVQVCALVTCTHPPVRQERRT